MSLKKSVIKGDDLVLIDLTGDLGIVRAWAREDMEYRAGASSEFSVGIYPGTIPGVTGLTINVNHWDVYTESDPNLASVLLSKLLPTG